MAGRKLKIIPLGGLGEIGRNMTLLEYGNNIIVVDVGVKFPTADQYGIDLVIPDWHYLRERREHVRGIVLTHGHEDHIGALPFLLRDGFHDVPIYATRLTRGLVEGKLDQHGLLEGVTIHTIRPSERFRVGPFEIEPVHVAHSIPDAVALAIRSPAGLVVVTGDYKFDHTPPIGKPTDVATLGRLGAEGVLALLGDSTNAEVEGTTPSERVVEESISRIFSEVKGRIIVATFASSLARINQILHTAAEHGRKVAVTGRSMVQNVDIALELGYLQAPEGLIVPIEEALQLPPERICLLTTGSQGEPAAGLARLANGAHRQIQIMPGDTVIVSAHPIPGNEEAVSRVIDNLYRLGADVIYGRMARVHVSGHGARDELRLMLNLLRPKYVIPVHGQYRMQVQHARLAEQMGIPRDHIFVLQNGQALLLNEKSANVDETLPLKEVYVDGNRVGEIGEVVLRDREMLARDGFFITVLTLDRQSGELIGNPQLLSRGFVYLRESEELLNAIAERVRKTVRSSSNGQRPDVNALETRLRSTVSRYLYEETGCRPFVMAVVNVV